MSRNVKNWKLPVYEMNEVESSNPAGNSKKWNWKIIQELEQQIRIVTAIRKMHLAVDFALVRQNARL